MKVSIIIPVYNVEQYLKQCIDSVIRQTYKNLEIILVDDGSIDRSGKICDEYKALDNRIKVIRKPNGGLMSAWKKGFLASTGEYVGFVDSDDWIDEDMYEKLLRNAVEYKADIVICQLIKEINYPKIKKLKEKLNLEPGLYNTEKIKKEILNGIINNGGYLDRKLSPNRVTKLFKRDLIFNNLKFCEDSISLGEDLVISFSSVCDAKRLVILSDFYPYHYRINKQSMTGKYDENRIEKINLLNSKLQEIANFKNQKILDQIANDHVSLVLLCIESEVLYSNFTKKDVLKRVINISNSNSFNTALATGNIKNFPLKYKFLLYLIKHKQYYLLYFFQRILNSIKNSIKKIL